MMNAGYDTSADIWSLACSIYELGTGRNWDFFQSDCSTAFSMFFFTDPTDRLPMLQGYLFDPRCMEARPKGWQVRLGKNSVILGAHRNYDVGFFLGHDIRLLVTYSLTVLQGSCYSQ